MSIHFQYYESPYGNLKIAVNENRLVLCDWTYRKMRKAIDQRIYKGLNAEFKEASHPIIDATIVQLEEYFSGNRTHFDLPLQCVGSDFQQQVWTALQAIPYGETRSYLALSKSLNDFNASR